MSRSCKIKFEFEFEMYKSFVICLFAETDNDKY